MPTTQTKMFWLKKKVDQFHAIDNTKTSKNVKNELQIIPTSASGSSSVSSMSTFPPSHLHYSQWININTNSNSNVKINVNGNKLLDY